MSALILAERETVDTSSQSSSSPRRASPARAARSRRLERIIIIALLVVGGLLRTREYLADRSLWLDELWITRNVVGRSFVGLLKPLAGTQSAPVGWLWLQHSAVSMFGDSEWVLRLVPFLLSIGSLVVFHYVVTRWLSGLSALLASAMFALSPLLIRYSVEVKQYGSDVFFVLLVVALTTALHDRPSRVLLIVWTVVCIVAMWSSNAAVFAIAASGATLVALRVRERRSLAPVCGAAVVLAASFALEYAVSLRASEDNPNLRRYWAPLMAPQHVGPGETLSWLWQALIHLAENPLQLASGALGIAAVFIGSALFVARRGWPALLLLSPVAAVVAAALLRKYPFSGRLILWLAVVSRDVVDIHR